MGSVVHKYPLASSITMPMGAQVLHVAEQLGKPFLWALVDTSRGTMTRSFVIAGTGHYLDPVTLGRFVGTVLLEYGALVLHVWEEEA